MTLIPSETQEILLLCGSPGAGKTYYFEQPELSELFKDYIVLSTDDIGTVKKLLKLLRFYLKEKKSVIISNTNSIKIGTYDPVKNRGTVGRDLYIRTAQEFSVPIRALYFDIPKDLCLKQNENRSLTTDKKIPKIAVHKFYKNMRENPLSVDEGFSEVLVIKGK